MPHRATVYTVEVHQRGDRDDTKPLGDIDEAGMYLGDYLQAVLSGGFTAENLDKTKTAQVAGAQITGDDLQVIMTHGQSGVSADIVDEEGSVRAQRRTVDTERVRCGVLFRLPRAQSRGWMAVHLNGGHSVKGLLAGGLIPHFQAQFPDLILEIRPFVAVPVIKEAVEQNKIANVRLVKLGKPSDIADSRHWVEEGEFAKIQLRISPAERTKRLLGGLAAKAIGGDDAARRQIVRFDGMEFDEAKIEVVFDDGAHRTFNIERPGAGHAFSEDIQLDTAPPAGEPTTESIFAELDRVLLDVM